MPSIKKQLSLPVDEYTSPCDAWVDKKDSVAIAHKKMSEGGYRHIPVLEDGKPVGIISSRDLYVVDQINESSAKVTAGMIMTDMPYTAMSGTPLEVVAFDMSTKKIGSAIIVNDQGKIEGIFTTTDALNALVEILRGEYS